MGSDGRMRAAEALARGMKRLRRRLGLTQAGLAESVDVHVQYISQVERQQRAPSLEVIDRIAAALDVSAAALLAEGEHDGGAGPVEPSEQVPRLLAMWPRKDQAKLVRLLVDLRQMARPRRAHRKRRS